MCEILAVRTHQAPIAAAVRPPVPDRYISAVRLRLPAMHPSKRMHAVKSEKLHGKTIVLTVTESIAAVETVKPARELIRHGAANRSASSA